MKLQDFPNRLLPMNRRSFLFLSGMLGVGAAATGALISESEAAKFDRNRHKISKTLPTSILRDLNILIAKVAEHID